jgi:hypothetical protein
MSAGAVGVPAPTPMRMPSPTGALPLRLVASGGELIPEERTIFSGTFGVPALRFTRRGRIVIGILATCAVVALALLLAASVDASPPQVDHEVTVSAGQTLSSVAAAELPSLPIPDGVSRIQLVNGLNTSQVHAGQSLLIPRMP